MSEPAVLFLDANSLASPVTRTLVIAGARADGLEVTWSAHVEGEADRHTRGEASLVSTVRTGILGMELSPTATSTEGLVTVSVEDQQVVADAIRADARYLLTIDVDDFAVEDLTGGRMSAVNPDYFMALRFTERAYREGVGLLAEVAKNPRRTEADVHRMLGRRHPHLTRRFANAYDTAPVPADQDQPSVLFRGVACLRCESRLEVGEGGRLGLCVRHRD
ncbi:hypothetical protein [Ornithinimicrobium faecis]|uniref:PIN domain-containing protein n=1 Tax=Ornithinimicrobium faecis TaxID=2934158 RepID=A0ABY4YPS4_9MICO|nr:MULTISPECIES: hypothetical protein [unclassified Ornithinimicrobium]USQ78561.1 hypothetical protein NF556_13055 [Ornithinimicrobium sp. HY1793]